MKSYFAIIERILNEGEPKQATRYNSQGEAEPVENGTIGLSQVYWEHNMSEGFPLLTCRRMPWVSMCVELEGFVKGITSKKWYQERGCKFWDWWANPQAINTRYLSEQDRIRTQNLLPVDLMDHIDEKTHKKKLAEKLDDLGPIYGYQWRNFGEYYGYDNWGKHEWYENGQEDLYGYDKDRLDKGLPHHAIKSSKDQLARIVSTLKNNPYDRRMVCSAWNPNQIHIMALPPCHLLWNVCVYGDKLNLHWHQRSCDTLRGIPNNIASYALLLLLLCAESGLRPGKLSAMFMDCHLYDNDMEHAKELIKLPTFDLPYVEVLNPLKKTFSIFDWTHKDIQLIDYQHGPSIKFNAITV